MPALTLEAPVHWLAMIFGVITGVLGVLLTMFPSLSQAPLNLWMAGILIFTTLTSALFTTVNERADRQASEEFENLTLGRGGYPTVTVLGFMPLKEQIVDGRVLANVMMLNYSKVPV